jgi:hypothetical protein
MISSCERKHLLKNFIGCSSIAGIFKSAVSNFGTEPFINAQRDVCSC